MDYFIRWQFTQNNPIRFKSQEEIIVSTLIPLVNKESFQERITNFYITKINYTTVRLQVFTTDDHLTEIQKIVENFTAPLILKQKEGPTQNIMISKGYGPPSIEMDFRKYLEDITRIGLDLHQKNLVLAKQFAVQTRFEAQPRGDLHPREILEKHLHEYSEHYRLIEKNNSTLSKFWNDFCFYYKNCTPWDHFYYNLVLGADARPNTSREQFVKFLSNPNSFS